MIICNYAKYRIFKLQKALNSNVLYFYCERKIAKKILFEAQKLWRLNFSNSVCLHKNRRFLIIILDQQQYSCDYKHNTDDTITEESELIGKY